MKQHRLRPKIPRTVKSHTIPLCPEDDINEYGHVQLSLIWLSSWMGTTSTLFSNSLVRTRSTLSHKILSLWMVRAKIVCKLFWCCFYQHQSSARTASGADRRVYEWSSTSSRLKFLARSKVTQFHSVRKMTSMYMGVFSYHDSYPLFGLAHEWVIIKVVLLCW